MKLTYLKSNHPYNYRHFEESEVSVIGKEIRTPKNLLPRECYKLLYESDNTIDYIPISEVENGNWTMIYR